MAVKSTIAFRTILKMVFLGAFASLFLTFTVQASGRLQQTGNRPVVVVIDPGHGGDNNGTRENGVLEKSMTLTVAKAMYQELSKFDNIKVYMTRTEDVDMTLKERAEMAAELGADFLFSLHFNASETHYTFGSEVWTSLVPEYHNYGYQFGTVALREYRDMGLHLRGIKTRIGNSGDYYGILRESVALNVPAVIIEHCYVDHDFDYPYCDDNEDLKAFGKADAKAVAEYFGLKSTSLGVDYSDYPSTLPAVVKGELVPRAYADDTTPEICEIAVKEAHLDEDRLLIEVRGSDEQSNLVYYSYSVDGGLNFSDLLPWPEGDILTGEFSGRAVIELSLNGEQDAAICFRVYNPYDLYTSSNMIYVADLKNAAMSQEEPAETEEVITPSMEDATDTILLPSPTEAPKKENHLGMVMKTLEFLILIMAILFLMCLFGFLIVRKRHRSE